MFVASIVKIKTIDKDVLVSEWILVHSGWSAPVNMSVNSLPMDAPDMSH